MPTIVENAAKGQRKAMEYLYERNRQKVFYMAQKLFLDEKRATDAVIYVFKHMWSSISSLNIMTEEEFADAVVLETADYCKKKVAKKNPKAFRIPQNKNFRLDYQAGAYGGTEDYGDFVLGQLPELHRFILVLHAACGLSRGQLAKILKCDEKLVDSALDEEKNNVERLLAIAGNGNIVTYEAFLDALAENERKAAVPAKADGEIHAAIDEIAKPAEQKKKRRAVIGITAFAACCLIVVGIIFAMGFGRAGTDAGESAAGPDASPAYYADIEIQDYGTITIALDEEAAPITTENFVTLAESGFYDGLTFHRIMEGFMMQGGDPSGDGTGGAENTIVGEFSDNGYENNLSHTRGAVSMARSNDYNSASSQFFIVHEDSTFLDGQYAVFGYVTEGLEVVDKVCEAAEPTDGNGTITAEEQPVITAVTIRTE